MSGVTLGRRGTRLVAAAPTGVAPERAWRLLRDTRRWPAWGPSVRAVESETRLVGPGSTGRVRTPLGWVRFRVTGYRRRRWTWRVAGLPATGHEVRVVDGTTRVAIDVPAAAAVYLPVCAVGVRRLVDLLDGPGEPAEGAEGERRDDREDGG